MIYFPVVLVPLTEEADHRVEEEQEEEDQDEDFLGSDLYRVSGSGLVGRNIGEATEVITARGTN